MRLKCIKLAGFKSFVDPTTVSFPGNLTGIVGPNGCGKSNVIDAVRWVMGESSAKQLRGESITDVIFSGSNSRKPTGQASIELVFDNSDDRVGGQYANYAEIAIRRQVTRDGQSIYSINGTRCRRRDIQDIFLGTGLGPRSYSIIEQGMISNLIEAKPEELRNYLEEAAGISKYKERRRETENRIRHTKENLERLGDLRDELERQLGRLQRQARAAEKYKEYKATERRLKAELLALRWRAMSDELAERDRLVEQLDLALEQARTQRQSVISNIDRQRTALGELTGETAKVQQRYYELGAGIARIEEQLQSREQRIRQLRGDLDETNQRQSEAGHHLELDARRIGELEAELQRIEPQRGSASAAEAEAGEALQAAEAAMASWQTGWEAFNQDAAEPRRRMEVEASRIGQLEQSLQRIAQRLERMAEDAPQRIIDEQSGDLQSLEARIAELEAAMAGLDTELAALGERLVAARGDLEQSDLALADARGEEQVLRGRRASLEALQESALGETEGATADWLGQRGLGGQPRLGERVQVQPGWETAVETVLDQALKAVVVDRLDDHAGDLDALEDAELTLLEGGSGGGSAAGADGQGRRPLAALVSGDDDLASMLAGVWAAESLGEALAMRERLQGAERIVTRDGVLVGRRWLRLARGDAASKGVLRRAQEIETLDAQLQTLAADVAAREQASADHRRQLQELEAAREAAQARQAELSREFGNLRADRSARQARIEEATARVERITRERAELEDQRSAETEALEAARQARSAAEADVTRLDGQRAALLTERDTLRATLEAARDKARAAREAAYELELRRSNLTTQLESTRAARERLESQRSVLSERISGLQDSLSEQEAPLGALRTELEGELAGRVEVEQALSAARRQQAEAEEAVRALEQDRSRADDSVAEAQSRLEEARMERQAVDVRRRTVEEALAEADTEAATVLEALEEGASETAWQEELERLEKRIERLGPINLAAIEEFEQQSERKTYLDAQDADLVEALSTLEEAIRKIDRETRARFKETFDQVNSGLQELFPKVFGGGHAYLELTGDDLLDTGVAIMARPPGKRNSSIHLLSGGEKALTAIALVFSIFQLNPAPFCMLDEVDAPLDDANVGRFCRMVTEMSAGVQFIFITHNKISMEMAEQLMGVTMQEAGVSRLVTVDVEAAAAMATG